MFRISQPWLRRTGFAPCGLAAILLVGAAHDPVNCRAADPVNGPLPAREAAAEIDQRLAAEIGWGEDELAPPSSDETFLRRLFFDSVGEPPTPQDVLAFLIDRDENKRSRVIDRLLDDPRFGRNWSAYWRDVILMRQTEQRAGLAANAMRQFLQEQLNANTPWDKIAASFITAEGDVREIGAAGLIMAQGGRPEDTVSEISRVFLGIQIQCAQCHDHPTDRWRRQQFHQLAAFFPRVAIRPIREEQRLISYEVTATDLPVFRRQGNANNRFRGTPEHRMPDLEHPEQEGKVMQPVFFATGDKLSIGTRDSARREALAAWITSVNNPWFSRALVNRLWTELVGAGFYDAIDDIGPDRSAKAIDTLDYIANDFVAAEHDVKRLMRVIMNTEAYQRASRNRPLPGDDSSAFVANCAQRLRADQLFNSILSVLELKERQTPNAGYGMMRSRFASPRLVFGQAFGFDPSEPRDEIKGSIPQALAMMNSQIVTNGVRAVPGAMLHRMLREYPSDQDLVVALYLKTLSRRPTPDEFKISLEHISEASQRAAGFEDLLWALLNSTDFLFRR